MTSPIHARLSDERVNAIFALKAEGKSNRAIAAQLEISASVVSDYLTGKRQRSEAPPAAVEPTSLDEYRSFVESKLALSVPTGIAGAEVSSPHMFPHQEALTRWALRRGRCAVFAHMGLGKSRVALFWSNTVSEYTGKPVLVLTPLAVARQFEREGSSVGIHATVIRDAGDVVHGINVANYERLHRLDPSVFGGVVYDESSIVKGLGSRTLEQLIEAFGSTPFRLAETATPAPNAFAELGQHCELLGICTRAEMLAEYFNHDGGDTSQWYLKGHARREFWRFVCSWGALLRSPADLGFDGSAYVLPPLTKHTHVIETGEAELRAAGKLFAEPVRGLMDRKSARRASIDARVTRCADLANADDEPWLIFCDYNDESKALAGAVRGAVEITGSMETEEKEAALERFLDGSARVLVTKASLAGHGLNLQHCSRVSFCGVSDSFEQQYQAIGRVHRFGQKRDVQVHYFLSDLERASLDNIRRKEAEAAQMAIELAVETREMVRAEVTGQTRATNPYEPLTPLSVPSWLEASNG